MTADHLARFFVEDFHTEQDTRRHEIRFGNNSEARPVSSPLNVGFQTSRGSQTPVSHLIDALSPIWHLLEGSGYSTSDQESPSALLSNPAKDWRLEELQTIAPRPFSGPSRSRSRDARSPDSPNDRPGRPWYRLAVPASSYVLTRAELQLAKPLPPSPAMPITPTEAASKINGNIDMSMVSDKLPPAPPGVGTSNRCSSAAPPVCHPRDSCYVSPPPVPANSSSAVTRDAVTAVRCTCRSCGHRLTAWQETELSVVFSRQAYLSVEHKTSLAARLGMTTDDIRHWFKNARRYRLRIDRHPSEFEETRL